MPAQILKRDSASGRLALLTTSSVDVLAEELAQVDEPFGLLLACDATALTDTTIENIATKADRAGLAYLCAWGPECKRVHDSFDRAIGAERLGSGSERVVMTTSHSEEPLEDAVRFLIYSAYPDESNPPCSLWIFACVDHGDWAARIIQAVDS